MTPPDLSYVWVRGEQIARLFRHLKLSSAQAETNQVVWYFEGGLVLRHVDGDDGSMRLSVTPPRSVGGAAAALAGVE